MKTIDDLGDLRGKRVLVRSDFNVPLDGTTITDDGRIRAALPTLTRLLDAGARVIVTAHLGRPKGEPDPKYSLAPVAARLGELLGKPVALADDVVGESAEATVAGLADGEIALLENIRFDARETSKDEAERGALADELAALADASSPTASAWCTASRRRSTTSRCGCPTRPACWCSARSRRCGRRPTTRSGPTWWCWAVRRSRTSSASSPTCSPRPTGC